MSAEDTDRRAATAPLVLLWIAIALAPVAGTLLVLSGGSGLLRAGGALAMLAVVLVALGSVLARAGAGGRAGSDVEAYVGDEIETLRADIRVDISRATKASHRVLGEQIAALGDTVEALRGQIEVLRSHVERSHIAAPAPVGGGGSVPGAAGVAGVPGGVFRHTETVQVTTRQTTMMDADSGYGDRSGSVYGSATASGAVPGQRRAEHDTYKGREEGYAGSRRARTDDEPTTGGWAASREVHLGERSSEVRIDDTAAQMRTQDRWASMVQREPDPTGARRAAETTGGRRRRDDSDWSGRQAETTQGWGTDRSAAEQVRALPAAPSGDQVPAWASGRTPRAEEPARVGTDPAQYRGGQHGGGYGWGSGGAEPGATTSGDIYGRAGGTAHGAGTPAREEYGRAPAEYGRRGGSEYGRAGDTTDHGRGPDTTGGLRTAGYVQAGVGADYGRTGGGEYGRAGGAEHGRAAGAQYGRPAGGEYGRAAGGEYGRAGGGGQYGQPGGGGEYGRAPNAEYGRADGDEYGRTGGTEYGRAGGTEYGRTAGTEYGGRGAQYQGYQDDEPTGRRSRHGDWR
jgi:hypothetical protein